MDNSLIILKFNGFSNSAPCTKLHKGEQKDRTKTLSEFPDYGTIETLKQRKTGERLRMDGESGPQTLTYYFIYCSLAPQEYYEQEEILRLRGAYAKKVR